MNGRDSYRLAEIERRMANMIRLATVSAVDPILAQCKVTIGDVTTAYLPWLTQRAGSDRTWWAPTVGEQVLVLAPAGELACAVVLPAAYQTAHAAPSIDPGVHVTQYSDGTIVKYDKTLHKVTVDCVGSIEAKAIGKITAQAGTSAEVTATTEIKATAGTNLTATVGGNLSANVTGNATVAAAVFTVNATTINLNGTINLTGAVALTGALVASGLVTSAGKVLSTHTHLYNPGPGASTPTAPPA